MGSPGERKSVTELKQWLTRFGERNQHHFQMNQIGATRARSVQRRIEKFESKSTSSSTKSNLPTLPTTDFQSAEDCATKPQNIIKPLKVDDLSKSHQLPLQPSGNYSPEALSSARITELHTGSATDPDRTDQIVATSYNSIEHKETRQEEIWTRNTRTGASVFLVARSESSDPSDDDDDASDSSPQIDFYDEVTLETTSKPVFRDFSNLSINAAVIRYSNSKDDWDENILQKFSSKIHYKNHNIPANKPRSQNDLNSFQLHLRKGKEESTMRSLVRRPNTRSVITKEDFAFDMDQDDFDETYSTSIRPDISADSLPRMDVFSASTMVEGRQRGEDLCLIREEPQHITEENLPMYRKLPLLLCNSLKGVEASAIDGKSQITKTYSNGTMPSPTGMHDAIICGPETLTSSSLELLCNGKYRVTVSADNGRDLDQESNTASTYSEDSAAADQPAVYPNAVDPRLRSLFPSHDSGASASAAPGARESAGHYDRRRPFRPHHHLPPPILEVSTLEEVDDNDDDATERESEVPAGSDDARAMGSSSRAVGPAAPRRTAAGSSTVATVVAQRRRALERHWAAQRAPVRVKKVQWVADPRAGTYRRKVVLVEQKEPEPPEEL